MRPLQKTTLVIWSEPEYPASQMEISDLVREAEVGEAYCAKNATERIEDPSKDPDWDGTEFFGVGEDGETDV